MKKIFGLIMVFSTLVMTAYGTGSLSDNLTVPHTFSSGETISSNKMNENFISIFEELNKLRKYVFSNGNIVAEFLSFKNNYALGITNKNYLIQINLGDGSFYNLDKSMTSIFYTTSDCSGDMYVYNIMPNEIFNFQTWNNNTNTNDIETYYASNKYFNISYKSEKRHGNCSDASQNTAEQILIKIYQNDSSITGITSSSFPTPILIGSK